MKPTKEEVEKYHYDPRGSGVNIYNTVTHFLEQKANETSGDMMTFEEYASGNGISIQGAWNAARVGMTPAKNAIALPDEDKWPEWAKSVKIIYSSFEPSQDNSVLVNGDCILCINRTKPQTIKMSREEAEVRLRALMGKEVEIIE